MTQAALPALPVFLMSGIRYLFPEIYLTVPNIRAVHLWHLDKLVHYGTICLDKLYHIGTLLSRQIVPYWYTFD